MAKFNYTARDSYGFVRKGVVDANSIQEAEEVLAQQGYKDIKVTVKGLISRDKQSASGGVQLFKQKVKERDLALFSRQLGAMLSAGISITTALEILSEQLPNKTMQETLKKSEMMFLVELP